MLVVFPAIAFRTFDVGDLRIDHGDIGISAPQHLDDKRIAVPICSTDISKLVKTPHRCAGRRVALHEGKRALLFLGPVRRLDLNQAAQHLLVVFAQPVFHRQRISSYPPSSAAAHPES